MLEDGEFLGRVLGPNQPQLSGDIRYGRVEQPSRVLEARCSVKEEATKGFLQVTDCKLLRCYRLYAAIRGTADTFRVHAVVPHMEEMTKDL